MVEGGMDPPPGVKPNFDNPDKTVWTASIVTQALCISIVGAILCLRVFVRLRIIHSFNLEDWLIVIGFVLAVAYSVIALIMNHFGGGINQWEVPKENLTAFGKTVYCTMVIYGPCAFCIKASIIVFLARVFNPIRRAVIILYIILGFLLAYYLPVLALKAAICRPIAKFWNPALEGQCFDQRALILADSVISVLSDMIIFIAPMPLTCNLHMQKKKRIKVAAVFSAGGLACVCSVIRLVDIVKNGLSENQTLVFMRVNLWGIAEVYIGLITACMPVLPAFWKHYFGSQDSSYVYSNSRSVDGLNSRRTIRQNTIKMSTQKTSDAGSDENVLITDVLGPMPSRTKRMSYGNMKYQQSDVSRDTPRSVTPPSPMFGEELTSITKTVEIKQTYE